MRTCLCRGWPGSHGCCLILLPHIPVVTWEARTVQGSGAGRVHASSFFPGQRKQAQILEEVPTFCPWLPAVGGHGASPIQAADQQRGSIGALPGRTAWELVCGILVAKLQPNHSLRSAPTVHPSTGRRGCERILPLPCTLW